MTGGASGSDPCCRGHRASPRCVCVGAPGPRRQLGLLCRRRNHSHTSGRSTYHQPLSQRLLVSRTVPSASEGTKETSDVGSCQMSPSSRWRGGSSPGPHAARPRRHSHTPACSPFSGTSGDQVEPTQNSSSNPSPVPSSILHVRLSGQTFRLAGAGPYPTFRSVTDVTYHDPEVIADGRKNIRPIRNH